MKIKILSSHTRFYHSSYKKNLRLRYGFLTFFAEYYDYKLWPNKNNIFLKKWCENCIHNQKSDKCCTLDEHAPTYMFMNMAPLRLMIMINELPINFLLAINNNDIIYFLHKNNLDGFYATNAGYGPVYLLLTSPKLVSPNNYQKVNHSFTNLNRDWNITLNPTLYINPTIEVLNNVRLNKIKDKCDYLSPKPNTINSLFKRNNQNTSILTFNVHYFRNVFNEYTYYELIDFFKNSEVDIICLQEAYFSSVIIDSIVLPFYETFSNDLRSIGYLNIHHDSQSGLVIASRFNIAQESSIFFKQRSKGCLHAKINGVHIYNLHLDVKSEETRLKQIRHVFKYIKLNENCIVVGDFNSLNKNDYSPKKYLDMIVKKRAYIPNKHLVINYVKKYMYDGIAYTNAKQITTSFHNVRCDYVFISRSMINSNNKLFILNNIRFSDHFPIIFEY